MKLNHDSWLKMTSLKINYFKFKYNIFSFFINVISLLNFHFDLIVLILSSFRNKSYLNENAVQNFPIVPIDTLNFDQEEDY